MATNIIEQLSPPLPLFFFICPPDLVQKSPFNMHALCPLQDTTRQHSKTHVKNDFCTLNSPDASQNVPFFKSFRQMA